MTHIEEKASSEGSQRHGKSRPRSHSVRACRGKDKAAVLDESESVDFKRAMTVKYKTEKAKAISKDLNLKTSNINQDKDKGKFYLYDFWWTHLVSTKDLCKIYQQQTNLFVFVFDNFYFLKINFNF